MVLLYLTRQVVSTPLYLKNAFLLHVLRRKRVKRIPISSSLPVVGLDDKALQSKIFDLRQTGADPQIVEAWLTATQLCQIVVDRLILDMQAIEANLNYWQQSLRSDYHRWLFHFQRGPRRAARSLVRWMSRANQAAPFSATTRIEEAVLALRQLESIVLESLGIAFEATVELKLEANDQVADLEKEVHVRINSSLTKISNLLRKLRVQNSRIQDRSRIQKQMEGTLNASTDANDLKLLDRQFTEDSVKDSHASNYDINVLLVLVARVKDLLEIDMKCPLNQSPTKLIEKTIEYSKEVKRIMTIPRWARRPNRLQRHWLRYTLYSTIGFVIVRFFVNHSPLVGSDAMNKWASSVQFALDTHLIEPLENVVAEIFDTFHGAPGIVSREDYEESKESLKRMLTDFKADNTPHRSTDSQEELGATKSDSVLEGMDVMMRAYESELKSPVKNALFGQLSRALLIQVQKLKVDTESAMLELDQILRANELNVALIAAIPAILIAGGLLYFAWSYLINRSGPDPHKSRIPCRLALVELERALGRCKETNTDDKLLQGNVLYRLEKAYKACWNVFKSRETSSAESEWPSMRRDFIDLARPLSASQKLKICARMRVTYSVFQVI